MVELLYLVVERFPLELDVVLLRTESVGRTPKNASAGKMAESSKNLFSSKALLLLLYAIAT